MKYVTIVQLKQILVKTDLTRSSKSKDWEDLVAGPGELEEEPEGAGGGGGKVSGSTGGVAAARLEEPVCLLFLCHGGDSGVVQLGKFGSELDPGKPG